jgi:hypothetical protein
MIPKSGYRFSEKIMLQQKTWGMVPKYWGVGGGVFGRM